MFEDDNRTLRRGITVIIHRHAVTGVHGFCTPSRGNGTFGFATGSIFPLECTKRHGPRHSVQHLYTENCENTRTVTCVTETIKEKLETIVGLTQVLSINTYYGR